MLIVIMYGRLINSVLTVVWFILFKVVADITKKKLLLQVKTIMLDVLKTAI